MTDATQSPFQGFPTAATQFLKELALNQNREWFAEHKAEHEQFVKAPLGALLQSVTAQLDSTPLPLVGDPKRSMFRINRDVRFSADKSPYKTNASAIWSRDGSKTSPGLVYFQSAPRKSSRQRASTCRCQRTFTGCVRGWHGTLKVGQPCARAWTNRI